MTMENRDAENTADRPGATIPGVTADGTKLPKHVPVMPGGKCSIMCDHEGIDRETSHAAAVASWRAGRAAEDLARAPRIDLAPTDGQTVVIDMWEVNQREMERRVAAGEPLPADGTGRQITPAQVAAWRAERPDGQVAAVNPASPVLFCATCGAWVGMVDNLLEHLDKSGKPVALDHDVVGVVGADPVDVVDAELVPYDSATLTDLAEEVGMAARCPASCGLPADPDPEHRREIGCPVHPDGAHRCYRRPRHQYGQQGETDARLSDADHECDCGFVWLNLTGGLAAHRRAVNAGSANGRTEFARRVLTALRQAGFDIPRTAHRTAADIVRAVAEQTGVAL